MIEPPEALFRRKACFIFQLKSDFRRQTRYNNSVDLGYLYGIEVQRPPCWLIHFSFSATDCLSWEI